MRKFFMLALLACCWLGTNSSARSEICNIGAGIGAAIYDGLIRNVLRAREEEANG